MKKIILTVLVFLMSTLSVLATELPLNIQSALKKQISGVSIRFDGLVEFPDGTQYLPVFPMDLKKDTPGKVVLTYPSGKSLLEEPAMVLFDNNFAMLKILKSQTHNPTVIFYNDMPLCVKRGLLPQDLLVPENLVLPEELEILLGDLSIPLEKLGDEFDYFKDFDRFFDPQKAQEVKKQNPLPSVSAFGKSYPCLANKMIYAINYQANVVYLINPETGKVAKVIALRSTPSNFIMSRNQRYLLVSMLGTSKLAVVDLDNNSVVKELESGILPTSIVVDSVQNIAYVANQNSSTISVIDLANMDLVDKIEAKGKPSKMSLAFDRKTLLYLDGDSESVYQVILNEDLKEVNFLFKTRNLSKILEVNDKIYLICRDRDYVTVIDACTNKPLTKITVGEKPTDMAVVGSKLYVVNSVSDSISVIDLNKDEKIKDVALATKGFPNKINILESSVRGIISTASAHEYVLFDFQNDCIVKKFPIDTIVNSIIVSKRH